ncbi:hypothetical protein AAZX31_20G033200 [Glycine max]
MFLSLKCYAHFPSLLVPLWLWNFRQDGLIELFGMLPCGTCTRLEFLSSKEPKTSIFLHHVLGSLWRGYSIFILPLLVS